MSSNSSFCFCFAVASSLAACSDWPGPAIGQLELGLSSGIGDVQFRLSNATFMLTGAAELELSSDDDAAPESDVIARALPAGEYSVQLLDGWQLERLGPDGPRVVSAELISNNPLAFGIADDQITSVTFQFRTSPSDAASSSDGQVNIGIEVDGIKTPRVLFTELMRNPQTLADSAGEWFELHNAGTEAVDLQGCSVGQGDQTLSIDVSLPIEPGGFVALANGESPGFVPALTYGGITLPNSTAFSLVLRCGERVLDSLALDPAATPNRAGRSLSLSAAALDASANDAAGNWCEGAESYNGDFGTPGAPNPACAP